MNKAKSTVKTFKVASIMLVTLSAHGSAIAQDYKVERETVPTQSAFLKSAPSTVTSSDRATPMEMRNYLYSGKKVIQPTVINIKAPVKTQNTRQKLRIKIIKTEPIPTSDPFLRR